MLPIAALPTTSGFSEWGLAGVVVASQNLGGEGGDPSENGYGLLQIRLAVVN